jgi:hypothetical protein
VEKSKAQRYDGPWPTKLNWTYVAFVLEHSIELLTQWADKGGRRYSFQLNHGPVFHNLILSSGHRHLAYSVDLQFAVKVESGAERNGSEHVLSPEHYLVLAFENG